MVTMAKIKGRDKMKEYIKKYSGNSFDFFSLKNDGDSARVRFLHTNDEDLELALVHKVEIDGKERWVECLEDGCPLCESHGRPALKLFLFLYDHSDDKIKVWERGATMVDSMLGFIDKYGDLNNRDYEIVRHGKKGDNKTSYQLFPEDKGPLLDANKKEIELPKRPPLYGKVVLQATAEQIKDMVVVPQERNRTSGAKGDLGF